ncbi:MAG: hypothetical protein IT440_11725 [Phycisphaeraceae bacterium]|nr:hypothetical protein [Phycisphaeraceae bacterium]
MLRYVMASVAAVLLLGTTAWSLDDSDLLFHLSFENGVAAEFARASGVPKHAPGVEERLVPGVLGRGYRFTGVGSTLEFPVADASGRTSGEMYDLKVNMLPHAGTVSLWIQALDNTHNLLHRYFLANGTQGLVQLIRDQYTHNHWACGRRSGVLYDQVMPPGKWFQFVLTWRDGEASGYVNGERMTVDSAVQAMTELPRTFQVAAEGVRWLDFQVKEITDDAVIDEVQIFRRALEPQEVWALFERGHVTGSMRSGNTEGHVTAPKREYVPVVVHASTMKSSITPDGDLREWMPLPAHGVLTERRIAVVDDDPSHVWLASDDTHLYLAYRCEVDASIRSDPTHIHYPVGEFAAASDKRDADLSEDDAVELHIRNGAGQVHRIAFNAGGGLRDERDGQATWNANIRGVSRSDFTDWTAEYAIPLADLGVALGQTLDFNVKRGWKRFKSSRNSLCTDVQSQPDWGRLVLGGQAAAAITELGDARNGRIRIVGRVAGPDGDYALEVRGGELKIEQVIHCREGVAEFVVEHTLTEAQDTALVATVRDPASQLLLARTMPFVFIKPAQMELASYPGWGKLDVRFAPATADLAGLSASIELHHNGKAIQQQIIASFTGAMAEVRFDLQSVPEGECEVIAQLRQGDRVISEMKQSYTKEPMPPWYGSKAGVIDTPPVPWTEPRLEGGTVRLLGKEITFKDTLLPAQVVTGGKEMLAEPMRFVATRGHETFDIVTGICEISQPTPREVHWRGAGSQHDVTVEVSGRLEFDGFIWMKITVAGQPVDSLALHIPMRRDAATMSTMQPKMGDQPVRTPWFSHWVGNMHGGISWWWEHQYTWTGDRIVTLTPSAKQTVVRIPFFGATTDFPSPRTVELGLAITPSRPVRDDWRLLQLAGGAEYGNLDYTFATPNYAKPRYDDEKTYEPLRQDILQRQRVHRPQSGWYAFGPFMWVGAPEYRNWWREWRCSDTVLSLPDPASQAWGSACHNSSASNLQISLLDAYMAHYPQRGLYFDCMINLACANEAHGCGWIAPDGRRLPSIPLLATRRHYERLYNLVKQHDPVLGWVRHHDWGPSPMIAAFCDDNWIGEGYISAVKASPTSSYFESMDLPRVRLQFGKNHWGHLTAWLTELGTAVDNTPEDRARVYGKYNPERQC